MYSIANFLSFLSEIFHGKNDGKVSLGGRASSNLKITDRMHAFAGEEQK